MHSEISLTDQPRRSFIETSRRAQIIDCAVDAIAELGFARASLAQIAKRAGVSTGVILYYFAGKDELIREVAAYVFTAGEAFMRSRVDASEPRAALLTFIKACVAFIAANPKNVLAVMNILRAGCTDSGAPRFDPAVTRPRQEGFAAILAWGQAIGVFRPFAIPIMVTTIIEAVDAIPPELAANPSLDLNAYADELAMLFDHATAMKG
jgi:AcrR family transcriptional regulator